MCLLEMMVVGAFEGVLTLREYACVHPFIRDYVHRLAGLLVAWHLC